MSRNHRGSGLAIGTLFAFTFSTSAYGYIDSGTGSFLLQSAVAGLLGGAFVLKTFWANVRCAVARRTARTQPDARGE